MCSVPSGADNHSINYYPQSNYLSIDVKEHFSR